MDKLKIFVRYLPGASGHFISLLLLTLIKDIDIKETHRGHLNVNDINNGHNFNNQWSLAFKQLTTMDIDLEFSVKWIQQNFKFNKIDQLYYIVHTHAINPEPLLLAFDNTKLINISVTDENSDQLAYNWVTKSCFLHNQWDILNQSLQLINQQYNKLKDLTEVNQMTDLKLLTYIQKFRLELAKNNFNQFNLDKLSNTLTIKFNDIMSGHLATNLDNIIDFVGIDVTPNRKTRAIELIEKYARAQRPVPWLQQLNEYN
jgi:hypothetical protein